MSHKRYDFMSPLCCCWFHQYRKRCKISTKLPFKLINYKKCSCKKSKNKRVRADRMEKKRPRKTSKYQIQLRSTNLLNVFNGHKYLYCVVVLSMFALLLLYGNALIGTIIYSIRNKDDHRFAQTKVFEYARKQ